MAAFPPHLQAMPAPPPGYVLMPPYLMPASASMPAPAPAPVPYAAPMPMMSPPGMVPVGMMPPPPQAQGWYYVPPAPTAATQQPTPAAVQIPMPMPSAMTRAQPTQPLHSVDRRDHGRKSHAAPPKPVVWSEKATADAIASDARGWEVEPGVVNVRLLLLKSRDMRRKLRAAMHHATRPRQLLNHNEAAKVQRRDHFAARLAAMERTARACGMLPATEELALAQAAIFRAQSLPDVQDTGSASSGSEPLQPLPTKDLTTDVAQGDNDGDSGFDATAMWSSPELRRFFLLRLSALPLDASATTCGDSVSSAGVESGDVSAVAPTHCDRNYEEAVALFKDGRMAPATTRAAIHAALYRKFILSAAFHAARVLELTASACA